MVLTEGAECQGRLSLASSCPTLTGHEVGRHINASGVGSAHSQDAHCERPIAGGGHQRGVPICQLVWDEHARHCNTHTHTHTHTHAHTHTHTHTHTNTHTHTHSNSY